MLKCPICDVPLEQLSHSKLTIHECPQCKGEWFVGADLRDAIDKKDNDLRWLDFSLFEEKGKQHHTREGKRECPGCSRTMDSLRYLHSGVVVDKCELCGGVWLDKAEFERIIGYLEKLVVTETASQYVRDAFQQFKEIGTGPTEVVSEIRDFLVVVKLLELRWSVEHPKIAHILEGVSHSLPGA